MPKNYEISSRAPRYAATAAAALALVASGCGKRSGYEEGPIAATNTVTAVESERPAATTVESVAENSTETVQETVTNAVELPAYESWGKLLGQFGDNPLEPEINIDESVEDITVTVKNPSGETVEPSQVSVAGVHGDQPLKLISQDTGDMTTEMSGAVGDISLVVYLPSLEAGEEISFKVGYQPPKPDEYICIVASVPQGWLYQRCNFNFEEANK